MSEIKAVYQLSIPGSLDSFRGRACVLPAHDPNWIAPTTDDVAGVIKLAGWTPETISKILGSEDVTMAKTKGDKQEVSYPAWRLLLLHSGVISCQDELAISRQS